MKHQYKHRTHTVGIIVAVFAAVGLVWAPVANAEEGGGSSEQSQQSVEKKARETRERAEAKAKEAREGMNERKEEASKRLSDTKRTVCENRKGRIATLTDGVAERAEKQIAVLTKISERVQAFYQEKGMTLATYDALVSDVDAKKAAAEAALADIRTRAEGFDCSGEDPKGNLGIYKETVKTKIAAIKEYRTAVRNLIIGVKSVQSEEQR